MTSSEQWRLIKRIVDKALNRPTTERAAYLDANCKDPRVRAEVESLLAYEVSGFMAESPSGAEGPISSRLPAGAHLGNFEIVELIGAGGMGDVYRGTDTRLGRSVAIKVLPPEFAADPNRRSRFEQEARAAAALNHPHIAVVHDVGHEPVDPDGDPDGPQVHYIVQEFLAGESLGSLMRKGALSPRRVVHLAVEITEALAAAHAAGIVHRDLKPDNVFVTRDGHAKLLDFGVAKLGPEFIERRKMTEMKTQHLTAAGGIVGTAAYMAPEQLRGQQVDSQADLWALGVLIYEMTAGTHPFLGETPADTASAILGNQPEPLEQLVKDAPPYLASVVDGLLHKDPRQRPSVGDLLALLELSRSSVSGEALAAALARRWRPSPRLVASVLLVIGVAAIWAYAAWAEAARLNRARLELLPNLQRLVVEFDDATWDQEAASAWEAYIVAQDIRSVLGDNPALEELVDKVSTPLTFESSPPGAQVRIRPYADQATDWLELGSTPVTARTPFGFLDLQLRGADVEPLDDVVWNWRFEEPDLSYRLAEAGTIPEGMALAGAATPWPGLWLPGFSGLQSRLGDSEVRPFLIDQHEATNAEYKRFVDAGGYRAPDYWPAFERGGELLSWDAGVAVLADQTGRPGPAGWVGGGYPAAQADFPVSGLSWYEAAAYCSWRDKDLPTVLQWRYAGVAWLNSVVGRSNMVDKGGPVAVGSLDAITRFGTHDMAGNVREWVYNADGAGNRYVLGGGWDDPVYQFPGYNQADEFDRSPTNGVRCARNPGPGDPVAEMRQPIVPPSDDSSTESVSDDIFELMRAQFDYDPIPLDTRVEAESVEAEWIRQKVSLRAVYGDERIIAHLVIPPNARPPYQSVFFWPGAAVARAGPSDDFLAAKLMGDQFHLLLQSGRVVVYPVLYDTHERAGDEPPPDRRDPEQQVRAFEHMKRHVQDAKRIVDYLQSHPDFDPERIGYTGGSWGARMGAFVLALDHRFRAAVLSSVSTSSPTEPPRMRSRNYLPRVRTPTLVLGGLLDWINPYEESQMPFYEALGSEHKQLRTFQASHVLPMVEALRDTLDWLDEHMGPVPLAPDSVVASGLDDERPVDSQD